jgi:hypothetical protein
MDRATTFYRKAFGWDVQPLSVEKHPVLNFHTVLTGDSDARLESLTPGVVNGCVVKREMVFRMRPF